MGQQLVKLADWHKIESIYNVSHADQVRAYIEEKPHLLDHLVDISAAIAEHFPGNRPARLEYVQDPDIENFEKLFIFVPYDGDIEDIYPVFRAFKTEWFIEHCGGIIQYVNVDLDFS